jgi:hypothetical protein
MGIQVTEEELQYIRERGKREGLKSCPESVWLPWIEERRVQVPVPTAKPNARCSGSPKGSGYHNFKEAEDWNSSTCKDCGMVVFRKDVEREGGSWAFYMED